MSVDYYVAVHQANWPTAAALQACLAERNYPVALEQAPPSPWTVAIGSLQVRFHRQPVEIEASVVRLSPTQSYGYWFARPPDANAQTPRGAAQAFELRKDEILEGRDINADLADIGAMSVRFGNGDYVLSLSFHGVSDEVRAGFYVMAAMIQCFGGYGFEFQGPSHGTRSYAEGLVSDAADDRQWK